MKAASAILAGVGLLSLAFVALSSTSAKGSTMPPTPPAPGPRLTTNPSNGNPISSFGSAPALSQSQLYALCASVGFPAASIAKAVALATRESGGRPGATLDSRGMTPAQLKAYWGKPALQEYSIGLWQINTLSSPQFDAESLKDPTYNARAALALSKNGTNWAPWGG